MEENINKEDDERADDCKRVANEREEFAGNCEEAAGNREEAANNSMRLAGNREGLPRRGLPRRKSIRLKGYDYSQAGLYFITICCQNMKHRFGKIQHGEMILNEYGQIAHDEWMNLTDRFPNIELDAFQIMPNHMHGIIALSSLSAAAVARSTLAVDRYGAENMPLSNPPADLKEDALENPPADFQTEAALQELWVTAEPTKQVQIKASFHNYFYFTKDLNNIPDFFIAIKLNEDGGFKEVYNGKGKLIYEKMLSHLSTERKHNFRLSVLKLEELNNHPDHEKIKRIHG